MPATEEMSARATASTEAAPPPQSRRHRLFFLLPLAVFVGLAATFLFGLGRDPSLVPSPLIGKSVPVFSLPPLQGRAHGLSSDDLKGKVSLVNVFASWCVACREEHPLLMALKEHAIVPINGIDYKDKPADAAAWLAAMGDPYARIGADLNGRVAIDWGVYGVPETFVIGRDARIAFKQIGPITPQVLDKTILPLIARLRRSRPSAARSSAGSSRP